MHFLLWQLIALTRKSKFQVHDIHDSKFKTDIQEIKPAKYLELHCTKNEDSIMDSFSKCDKIRSFLRIWSHLLKKSVMENFIFCVVSKIKERSSIQMLISSLANSDFFHKFFSKFEESNIFDHF